MENALKRRQKALGNKGFSLIELIIVIAIMAVLIAILAPQYLKYVETSKESADKTFADGLLTTTKVAAVDPDYMKLFQYITTFSVTWDSAGATDKVVITATAATGAPTNTATDTITALRTSFAAALDGYNAKVPQSSKFKTDKFVITATKNAAGIFEYTAKVGAANFN